MRLPTLNVWMYLFLLYGCLQTGVQTPAIPKRVSEWIVLSPPKPDSKDWYAANSSDYTWTVLKQGEQVVVRSAPLNGREAAKLPFRIMDAALRGGRLSFIKVANGWLIGRDQGEWGGDLWWYSTNGKRHYKISNEQARAFVKTPSGLFACAGLAHLSRDYGRLLRLSRGANGRWKSQQFVDLKNAPEVELVKPDGTLLIATTTRLVRLKADKSEDVLVKDAFWRGLYPESIVEMSNGDIYLGMRHGVARIRPLPDKKQRPYKVEWLLPNQTFVHAKPKYP